MHFKIRQYKNGDEKSILDIYNNELNQKRTMDQWVWQYLEPPMGRSIIYVICDKEEIIGHYAIIPIQGNIEGKKIIFGKAEGAFVKKKYRFIIAKKGLFKELIHQASNMAFRQGIPLIFGLTNSSRDFINAGFKKIGKVYAYQKQMKAIDKAKTWLRSRVRKRDYFFNSSFAQDIHNAYCRIKADQEIKRKRIVTDIFDGIPDGYQFNTSDLQTDKHILIDKNPEYLKWRFEKNPFITPVFVSARRDGDLLGWMILSVIEDTVKKGYIIDFFISQETDTVQYALFKKALRHFKSHKVAYISCWKSESLRDEMIMKNFARWGLRKVVSVMDLLLLYDNAKLDETFVSNIRHWSISMGMTEGRWG